MENNLSDKELLTELKKRFNKNKTDLKELKSLNKELKIVNKKLEESEALKSHFISNITNEIINPFTSILALSRQILTVKKEEWKKVITMTSLIHSEAFNLDFQFKNIFVAAKIEAGEIIPDPMNIDIKSLIENLIDSFKNEGKKKKINYIFNCKVSGKNNDPYIFKSDPEKIKLILSNLLSNAIKFSKQNGNIEITVKKEGEYLKFTVKDNGSGISPENQKIIFDRFKRLDSGINSLNRGHGLGLSINKALLEFMGGKIEVKSKLNIGSTFDIYIPEQESETSGSSSDGNEFMFDEGDTF